MGELQNVLIVGGSGGIGYGFVEKLINSPEISHLYATYRQSEKGEKLFNLQQQYPDKLSCLKVDVTNENDIINGLSQIQSQTPQLHLVINCVGILHEDNLQPEKSLKHIDYDNLIRYFQVNTIPSVLLAKYLVPLFKHQDRAIFAVISAKVGSIEDNRLGGWYGYRASKASLNMLLKNIAIEYSRTRKNAIVVALHPGTTDTELSKPFQKNVPPEKLFSIERCTTQLLNIINNLKREDNGKFFSWDGTYLPW